MSGSPYAGTEDDREFIYCDECELPPIFDLPPPPRPPWLQDQESSSDCHSDLDSLEVCDHLPGMDPMHQDGPLGSAFHSAAVIVVCSLVFVIFALVGAVICFRRRKSGFLPSAHGGAITSSSNLSSARSSLGRPGGHPQETLQPSAHHQNFVSSLIGQPKDHQQVGHNNLHQRPSVIHSTLPNHYIPDHLRSSSRRRLLENSQTINSDTRLMRLSQQPPSVAHHVTNHGMPHIIIGGQPFFLIPSESNPGNNQHAESCHTCESDPYAYPQAVPIYEEIDPKYAEVMLSDLASDYGQAGSNLGQSPAASSSVRVQQIPQNLLHRLQSSNLFRPVSPHPQTGDNSSSSEVTVETKVSGGRILMNPLLNNMDESADSYEMMIHSSPDSDKSKKDKVHSDSSTSSYYSSEGYKKQNLSRSMSQRKRNHNLSTESGGVSSSSSGVSPGNSNGGQATSSVYYYSDTLRNRDQVVDVKNKDKKTETTLV